MKTDIIRVCSQGARMEEAILQASKVAAYKGLPRNDELQLQLLTEETMGLMRAITGETEGLFWIEDEGGVYSLHLQVETVMNSRKREKLIEATTTGRNEAAKGLMGRLRDFFDQSEDEDVLIPSSPLLLPQMYEHSSTPVLDWEWTMTNYQDQLQALVQKQDAAALELWDELERSVVTHVADEVKVRIRHGEAELIIEKKLSVA